jgi:hypothetical protein
MYTTYGHLKQVGGYEKMTNIREFDKGQAVDVVRAVYNTYVSPDTTSTGLTPEQLFATIKHLPYT